MTESALRHDDARTTAAPAWACPEHQLPLAAEGEVLVCPRGERFPTKGGVPRFVDDGGYAAAFGEQWLRFRATQLDSVSGLTITGDRTRRCVGEGRWNDLARLDVLECGCGAGRFTEVLLAKGARVTSIDLSSAVDANAATFPPGPQHRIAQADIRRLPFPSGSFDVVFCLGVIQHTPSPEASIAALYDKVRPGGTLVIDHYAHNASWYTRTAPLVRHVLKRLPAGKGMRPVERLVNTFLPLHKAARNKKLSRKLLYRVSPIISYYEAFPTLTDEMQREWALLDTHDSLTDVYKHFRTEKNIRKTLEGLGAVRIVSRRHGDVIEARCEKPA